MSPRTGTGKSPSELLKAAQEVQPATVRLRRRIHRNPELGLQLPATQAAVLAELAELPVQVHTGTRCSSVLAVLDGAKPGPTVLLRGDMDALPLDEDTGLEFASEVAGSMHACGHDTHVAMLLSAARLLAQRRDALAGRVAMMFQPGEEGHFGARVMIEEGLLDRVRPDLAFALHITSTLESGVVTCRPGPVMASSDVLQLTVTGRGGHAAMPHDARDPVPAAAAVVGALQTMITRRFSVFDPVVLTIARITAGTTTNIIPETAYLEGTMRTLSESTRAAMHTEVREVCEHIAAAYGCTAQFDIQHGYPVTMNDSFIGPRVLDVAGAVLGSRHTVPMADPMMGAEDFSYVLQRIPGAMAFLGGCPPESSIDDVAPNHSNRVVFDEAAMAHGVAVYAGFALDAVNALDGLNVSRAAG